MTPTVPIAGLALLLALAACSDSGGDKAAATAKPSVSVSTPASPTASPADAGPTCSDLRGWTPDQVEKWVGDTMLALVEADGLQGSISGFQQLGFGSAIQRACLAAHPDNPSLALLAKIEYEQNKDEYAPSPTTSPPA